jgi:hypothetical protein
VGERVSCGTWTIQICQCGLGVALPKLLQSCDLCGVDVPGALDLLLRGHLASKQSSGWEWGEGRHSGGKSHAGTTNNTGWAQPCARRFQRYNIVQVGGWVHTCSVGTWSTHRDQPGHEGLVGDEGHPLCQVPVQVLQAAHGQAGVPTQEDHLHPPHRTTRMHNGMTGELELHGLLLQVKAVVACS